MYQGIYVAPLQVKANKNVVKNLNIFACRWDGGLVIINAENEDSALIMAREHTNIPMDMFQINKLPNASALCEPRILYMEVHNNDNIIAE